ncbi:MAG: T9SS type A sorting domain-containing protein [Ignavibacteria bacterium]
MDISYNDATIANSTDLSILKKITFSSTDVTFLLTDGTSVSKALSTVSKLTFSATGGQIPLPVELVSFTAAVNGNKVILDWNTATEVNNHGFDIERALSNTDNWEKIGFVPGHGNSNSFKEYSFTDLPKGSSKYRLKQIDNDGKYEYSGVVEAQIGISKQYVLKNYPNPFNPATKIAYSIPADGFVTLKIFDALGREAALLVNENKKAGNYEAVLNGSWLASGIYICKMISAGYSGSIKMLLIK